MSPDVLVFVRAEGPGGTSEAPENSVFLPLEEGVQVVPEEKQQ